MMEIPDWVNQDTFAEWVPRVERSGWDIMSPDEAGLFAEAVRLRQLIRNARHDADCFSWMCKACHWFEPCESDHDTSHDFEPLACNCFKAGIGDVGEEQRGS